MTRKRDSKGRFLEGTAPGPGRPARHVEREYLDAMMTEVTPAKWRQVVARALQDAIGGDGTARRWLSDYILGKPPQIVELQAYDARILADVLTAAKEHGLSAGALFDALLVEIHAAAELEAGHE